MHFAWQIYSKTQLEIYATELSQYEKERENAENMMKVSITKSINQQTLKLQSQLKRRFNEKKKNRFEDFKNAIIRKQEMHNRTTIHNSSSFQLHLHLKVLEIINNFNKVISKIHNNHMVLILVTLKEAQIIKQLNSVLPQIIVL